MKNILNNMKRKVQKEDRNSPRASNTQSSNESAQSVSSANSSFSSASRDSPPPVGRSGGSKTEAKEVSSSASSENTAAPLPQAFGKPPGPPDGSPPLAPSSPGLTFAPPTRTTSNSSSSKSLNDYPKMNATVEPPSPSARAKDVADGIQTRNSPAASLSPRANRSVASDQSKSSSPDKTAKATIFDSLPSLRETPAVDRQEVLRKKLEACCTLYDFTNDDQLREKEGKRQALLEIVEFINTTKAMYGEKIIAEIIETVSKNLFRSLPPSSQNANVESEDTEPVLEPAWPHLQLIYEFFLRFVVSPEVEARVMKKHIDTNFIIQFLSLFNSEDPRERDYLKTLLHRIYGKIMAHRSFIRKAIQQVFFSLIHEGQGHNGISELLEILGSIVNGFALPLKDEHRIFLEKSLIPLHKCKSLPSFHHQLTYCMTQYVEKEPKLIEKIILAQLRYWPVTNTPKEVLFLSEMEELLEVGRSAEISEAVLTKLFTKIAESIESPHFQVAERVLFLWNNENVVQFFNQHKNISFPLIVGALYRNTQEHWHRTVSELTYNVSNCMAQTDSTLFDLCFEMNSSRTEEQKVKDEEREKRWAQFEKQFI